jgi:hypothetical protein
MPMIKYLGMCVAHRAVTVSLPGYADDLRRLAKETAVDAALSEHAQHPDKTNLNIGDLIDKLRAIDERFARGHGDSDLEFSSDVSLEALSPYLVKGVLPPASTALLYGASGGGKTFFAIHLGGCIARGQPVFGRRARPGATLYVALEGKHGFGLRMRAWERDNGELGQCFARLKTQVTLGTGPASAAHVGQIIAAARRLSERAGCPTALIVIDTLACALTSDNENDAVTIAAVMAQCDRIKSETGATVLLLHHPGKDASKGPRGSYALRGAVDVMIRIDREADAAERTIVLDKVRDGPEGPLGTFTLRNVEFGEDEEGDPITSCVLVPSASTNTLRAPRTPKQGTAAAKALTELHELVLAEKGNLARRHERAPEGARLIELAEWRTACARRLLTLTGGAEDSERKAFDRAVEKLSELAQIETFGQVVWLIKRQWGTR